VGGLGAVLAITPPQLSTTSSINIAGGSVIGTTGTGSSASASSSSTSSAPTKSAKPVATKKATAGATTQPAASQSATATASPAATQTTAPVTSTVKDGTFTGPAVFVNYGTVQVKITVSNGKITDAVAVQAPRGKNDRYTNMAVPILKQQTLQAQSANIQGASGASYTSYGWFKSLQGAMAEAGL
jgi:uncharacterized protein with FMN-binding domain